jgi:RNA polymerase sigma-70 factor (ECF subfamily)
MEGAEAVAMNGPPELDGGTFRQLVEEHSRTMFRLAYRMTGNEQDAEDVVQETFLRAYRHMGRFDSRAQVSSWLHRIAANYAIDLLRRRKRWRMTSVEQLDYKTPLSSTEPGPERTAFGGEIHQTIDRALEALTPRERVAFVLRHYEGRSIEEIGRVLGTRTNATKNHVFRAVRKLRHALSATPELRS